MMEDLIYPAQLRCLIRIFVRRYCIVNDQRLIQVDKGYSKYCALARQGNIGVFAVRTNPMVHSSQSRKHAIILTPLNPSFTQFYYVKVGFIVVYIIFHISAQKHRLWVLVRTASPRRF